MRLMRRTPHSHQHRCSGKGITGIAGRLVSLLVALAFVNPASAANGFSETLTYSINPGNNSEYQVKVYHVHEPKGPMGAGPEVGAFFIHGLAHTGSFFKPLMTAVSGDPLSPVTDLYAIDLPGHGDSGSPPTILYGDMSLGEYVNAVSQTLEQMIGNNGRGIDILIGHSMGGGVVQLLQEELLNGVSDIKSTFGIQAVCLLASTLPDGVSWLAADAPLGAGAAKDLVNAFAVKTDPAKGWFEDVPDPLFVSLFYSLPPAGPPVAGAPAGAALAAIKSTEPFAAAAELVGLSADGTMAVPRPSVRKGAFEGISLEVIAFSKDGFFTAAEQDGLASYLQAGAKAVLVDDPEAVHGMPYTKPGSVKGFVK